MSMEKYFREFKCIEVQQTFYQIPRESRLRGWREKSGEGFEFIVKAWQGITHPVNSPTWRRFKGELRGRPGNYGLLRDTEEVLYAWEETIRALEILNGDKVVIQLPPSLEINNENIDEVFTVLDRFSGYDVIIILEPRHDSWLDDRVISFLRSRLIVHCVDPFKNDAYKTGRLYYFRLHGINGYNYGYKYTDRDLNKLCDMMLEKYFDLDVYIMFNNKFMYIDALNLRNLFRGRGIEAS